MAIQEIDGIDATHPEYDRFAPRWQRCRDCVDGSDAIKAATTDYFPALTGELPAVLGKATVHADYVRIDGRLQPPTNNPLVGQYEKRIALAAVYEAADKTLDPLLGALFRTPSEPTIPDALKQHLDNIDLAGTGYGAFKQQAGAEALEVGRYGVLVDWSPEQNRPFWRPYETEQIDDWRYGIRGGKKVLEYIKLRDPITERSSSGFGGEQVDRYRVLELDVLGTVQATVYTKRTVDDGKGGTKTGYEVDGPNQLLRQGVPLTEVPFVCFGRLDLDLCPQKPPLLGICDLQLDHYRLDGDLKWGIHQGCMGAWFVIGDGDPDQPKQYFFGGAVNRLAAGATADCKTLPADMIRFAKEEKKDNEQRMALMGARALLAPKREAETAEAAVIQRGGESASLSMISQALTTALTKCWYFHCVWMGLPTEGVGDELNRDFFPVKMTPEEATSQMALVQAGYMSEETFLENLYGGQLNRDPETERTRIGEQGPKAEPADASLLDEPAVEEAAA